MTGYFKFIYFLIHAITKTFTKRYSFKAVWFDSFENSRYVILQPDNI